MCPPKKILFYLQCPFSFVDFELNGSNQKINAHLLFLFAGRSADIEEGHVVQSALQGVVEGARRVVESSSAGCSLLVEFAQDAALRGTLHRKIKYQVNKFRSLYPTGILYLHVMNS